jgi:hypothetical protein
MIKGVYYEFISIPCRGERRTPYSMPLGILWDERPKFKLYKGVGLLRYLNDETTLLLYTPESPLDFYLSLIHDKTIELEGPCRPPREYVLYVRCRPRLLRVNKSYNLYECLDIEISHGRPVPYSRSYGCLVEMLVVLTKLEAGALDPSYIDYVERLRWCIERSSPQNEKLREVADVVLQRARELGQRAE